MDLPERRISHGLLWMISHLLLCGLLVLMVVPVAQAHAPRENYVWVNIEVDHVSGRFEINKGDLKNKLGIQIDGEGNAMLPSIKQSAAEVQAYFLDNFTLSFNGELKEIQFLEPSIFAEDSPFIQYHYKVDGVPENDQIVIRNTIFLTDEYVNDDRLHRSLIVVEYNKFRNLKFGAERTAFVFGPKTVEASLNVAEPNGILVWQDFFYQGLVHIWLGLDHMLFLLTLLLTVVLVKSGSEWAPALGWRKVFFNTLTIVTVFTVSHSITLALAALGFVNVPSGPIEAIIALSIIVVALNNLFPVFASHTWLLILCFGLVHGLGFASALGDLQFRNVRIERILIMFNIGVEIGQLIIVVLVLPVLFFLRKKLAYRVVIMPGLSILSVIIASVWLGSRMGWWA